MNTKLVLMSQLGVQSLSKTVYILLCCGHTTYTFHIIPCLKGDCFVHTPMNVWLDGSFNTFDFSTL